MQTDDLKRLVEATLDDMKARDIVSIDVHERSSVTDYMVIVSGTSQRHVQSIADAVAREAKSAGQQPLGIEGAQAGEWVLVDLGDVVVHVMQAQTREFYQLQRMWEAPSTEATAS